MDTTEYQSLVEASRKKSLYIQKKLEHLSGLLLLIGELTKKPPAKEHDYN